MSKNPEKISKLFDFNFFSRFTGSAVVSIVDKLYFSYKL
jgi:hypothetical protein